MPQSPGFGPTNSGARGLLLLPGQGSFGQAPHSDHDEDEPVQRGAHFDDRDGERVPEKQPQHQRKHHAAVGPLRNAPRTLAETKPGEEQGKGGPSRIDGEVDPSNSNPQGEQEPSGYGERCRRMTKIPIRNLVLRPLGSLPRDSMPKPQSSHSGKALPARNPHDCDRLFPFTRKDNRAPGASPIE